MFLIIPLIFIGGGLAGIGYIVWPKFKTLREREDLPEIKEDFWKLVFPELFGFLKITRENYRVSKDNLFVGYEKFLRRAKILSLKTDNTINKLLERRPRVKPDLPRPEFKKTQRTGEGEINHQFKNKEVHLIAEISKNPKDKNLYKALGALYLENRMVSDAREAFSVVLELDPNDEEAKQNLEKLWKAM